MRRHRRRLHTLPRPANPGWRRSEPPDRGRRLPCVLPPADQASARDPATPLPRAAAMLPIATRRAPQPCPCGMPAVAAVQPAQRASNPDLAKHLFADRDRVLPLLPSRHAVSASRYPLRRGWFPGRARPVRWQRIWSRFASGWVWQSHRRYPWESRRWAAGSAHQRLSRWRAPLMLRHSRSRHLALGSCQSPASRRSWAVFVRPERPQCSIALTPFPRHLSHRRRVRAWWWVIALAWDWRWCGYRRLMGWRRVHRLRTPQGRWRLPYVFPTSPGFFAWPSGFDLAECPRPASRRWDPEQSPVRQPVW